MAYKRITALDIWEIIRRWHHKQSISHIAFALGYDRKTIRKYIQAAQEKGIDLNQPLPPKEHVLNLFQNAAVEHEAVALSVPWHRRLKEVRYRPEELVPARR